MTSMDSSVRDKIGIGHETCMENSDSGLNHCKLPPDKYSKSLFKSNKACDIKAHNLNICQADDVSQSTISVSHCSQKSKEACDSTSKSSAVQSKESSLPKLAIQMRAQYQKLESTSVTDQTNSTPQLLGLQSAIDSTSASFTLIDQSYSPFSSTVSPTLTPTPLYALPHSSSEISSSNQASPQTPSSPPLSPITPLTNTITPTASKTPRSKKSLEKAAVSTQYIFVAAHQISEAQEHEKRNEIVEAVAKYREGVGTLLRGVQDSVAGPNEVLKSNTSASTNSIKSKKADDEANVARREGVRRKTFQYLQRAEQLLAKLTRNGASSASISQIQHDKECVSGIGISGLQCGVDVLRQYRVLGVSNIIIAQLPHSKHTVAIKTIQKNTSEGGSRSGAITAPTTPNLIPRGIAHIVPVICYHETESSIFLVMKYIRGGKLWDHIRKYVNKPITATPVPSAADSDLDNLYSGKRLLLDPCQEAIAFQSKSKDTPKSHKSTESKEDPSLCTLKQEKDLAKTAELTCDKVNIVPKVLTFKTEIAESKADLHDEDSVSHSLGINEPITAGDCTTMGDYDPTTMDSISSKFTSDGQVIARSGMVRYDRIDTSSCASDTTIGADWASEMDTSRIASSRLLTETANPKQVVFRNENVASVGPKSEYQRMEKFDDLCVPSERETKTSPIACLGKSEMNLRSDLEFYSGAFVSKSLSAEDLTLNSISVQENVNMQHSTISTINIIPEEVRLKDESPIGNDQNDDASVGSDTLSGVSDDFSCSLSANQMSEDKKQSQQQSDFNLLSECAVSDGRKRPQNTPDSSFIFLPQSDKGALRSYCQSTSADITTLEPSNTLENSLFNVTLNESSKNPGLLLAAKEVHTEKLLSLDGSDKTSGSLNNKKASNSLSKKSSQKPAPKLLKSNSDELKLDQKPLKPSGSDELKSVNGKGDNERCPSEPTSASSITLPSFSASQIADRSASEVASFDIEELIRNSRRLLQNVDMTLEHSKGKSVRPVPSEDSSTSIDQSELPLDSVSVGFDTPDIPSNSTRCSNVSSDNPPHSKIFADNTYSSIPSIALDTSRHALKPEVNDSVSLDKALRSPRNVDGKKVSPFESTKSSEKESPRPFLLLPKDSATSKEDSTNPSDIHTQIHLSGCPESEDDDAAQNRTKIPLLERQANFEKSDTTKSSLKQNQNIAEKVMKTIDIKNKLGNDSSPLSNDSTSISGITLNNSESNGGIDTSSDVFSKSGDRSGMTNTNDHLSSESTSGIKYCANPGLPSPNLEEVAPSTATLTVLLSEPLYLLPQTNEEIETAERNMKSPFSASLASTSNVSENFVSASLPHSEQLVSTDSTLMTPLPPPPAEFLADSTADLVTESFTLYSCQSEFSKDESSLCVTDSTQCNSVETQSFTATNSCKELSSAKSTSTSFINKTLSPDEKDQVIERKVSILRQTPLSELLDKYRRGAADGRDHLPEGLVKVWGAQIVSAMSGLHETGIVWGDFGPQNVLLGEGGCIFLTLETRWSTIDRGRPCGGHSKMHCRAQMRHILCHERSSEAASDLVLSDGEEENLTLCSACLGYIAPELQSPLAVPTVASDWWSVGALLYHLLTGFSVASQHPSGITSHTEISLPSHLSPEASMLLTQLLTAHPSERLGGGPTGSQEIKHHPFFLEAPWPT